MTHDDDDDDDDAPRGLTGLFQRLAALAIGLATALVTGVLRALAEAFRRAFGPRDDDR